jgi:hypothetical protein
MKEKAGHHSWRKEVGSPHRPQGHLSSDAQRGEAEGSIKQIAERAGRGSGGGMEQGIAIFFLRSLLFLQGAADQQLLVYSKRLFCELLGGESARGRWFGKKCKA